MDRQGILILSAGLLTAVFLAACAGTGKSVEPAPTAPAISVLPSTGLAQPSAGPAASQAGSQNSTPSQLAGTEAVIPAKATENALAPETNPVGDIPDTQVFITYTASPGGYSFEVPEGWARSNQGSEVRFVKQFDGVSVTLKPATSAPSAASVPQNEAAALAQSERAFKIGAVSDVKLPGGPAVRITASANSDPDPVTGKQVRLEEEFYLFSHNGMLATLKLWAPQGADNVDQWKRMTESFRWK